MIVCCERTVKTTVSDIGQLFTVLAGGRQVSQPGRTAALNAATCCASLSDVHQLNDRMSR